MKLRLLVLAALACALLSPVPAADAADPPPPGPTNIHALVSTPNGTLVAVTADLSTNDLLTRWVLLPGAEEWESTPINQKHIARGINLVVTGDEVVAVWYQGYPATPRLFTSSLRRDGAWTPRQRIGRDDEFALDPSVTVGPHGEQVVAWVGDDAHGVRSVRVAQRVRGTWRVRTIDDTGRSQHVPLPRPGIDAEGDITVVYSRAEREGRRKELMVADIDHRTGRITREELGYAGDRWVTPDYALHVTRTGGLVLAGPRTGTKADYGPGATRLRSPAGVWEPWVTKDGDYLAHPTMEADAADDVVLAGSAVWARDRGGEWLQADAGDRDTWRSAVSVADDGRAVAAYHLLDGATNVLRVIGTTDRRTWTVLADVAMPEETQGIVDLVLELAPSGDVWVSVKPVRPPGTPEDERIVWLEGALTP